MIQLLQGQPLPILPFVVCDSTGRILRTGSAPGQMVMLQAGDGEFAFVGSASLDTDYITDVTTAAAATPRPASPVTLDTTSVAADATAVAMLTNVAAGATVTIHGPASGTGTGDGNPVHLTFAVAGTYRVTVSHFPDLDFTAVIHAN